MTKGYFHGHEIEISPLGGWVFSDSKNPVTDVPCKKCGKIGDPDACLGTLPGVDFACCGHGNREESYVKFTNGVILRGFIIE